MHFLLALGILLLNCTTFEVGREPTLQSRAELTSVSHTECIFLTSRDRSRVRSGGIQEERKVEIK